MRRAALLSLVVHVAVAAIIWRTRVAPTPTVAAPSSEIDIEEIPLEAIDTSATPGALGNDPALAGSKDRQQITPSAHGTGATSEVPQSGGAVEPGGDVVSVWRGTSTLALGGNRREGGSFVGSTQMNEKDESTQTNERIKQTMRSALLEHDAAAGTLNEHPLLAALEDATAHGMAPIEGHAAFDAHADEHGTIYQIDVGDVSSDRVAWEQVAKDALAQLAGKPPLKIPRGGRGAVLRVALVTKYVLASGHSPSTAIDILGLPLSKGKGSDPMRVSILNPLPRIVMVPATVDGQAQLPMITWSLFELSLDPTDLDPHPRRVISAHVASAAAL